MLSTKQQQFVREYLIDLNATQAAIRAGYSEKGASVQGCQLLANPKIAAAVQKAVQKRSERTEITADYVLTSIRDTVERCREAVPVIDKEGNETGEYRFDSQGALRGLELLGKHLKLFTDRQEVSGNNGAPLEMTVRFIEPDGSGLSS